MQALKDIGALQLDGQNLLITHFFLWFFFILLLFSDPDPRKHFFSYEVEVYYLISLLVHTSFMYFSSTVITALKTLIWKFLLETA